MSAPAILLFAAIVYSFWAAWEQYDVPDADDPIGGACLSLWQQFGFFCGPRP